MYGPLHVSLPRLFFTGFAYLGFCSAFYFLCSCTARASISLFQYLRSIFNAKKFLDSTSAIARSQFGGPLGGQGETNGRAYALIYGTGNRAGITYAHYLAEKGFNLILIERDIQPLNDLENALKEQFS